MQNRLIRPRGLDETRVNNLIDALEASVHRTAPAAADAEVPASETLTYFHSRVLPKANLRSLVRALIKSRIAFDWTTAAMAVSLIQRYRRCNGSSTSVTPHMLHRLMIGFLLVAAKAHQDLVPTNRLVAKTVGISKLELSRIEAHACYGLDWRVNVDHNDLVRDEVELCGCSVQVDASPSVSHLSSAASPDGVSLQHVACTGSSEYVPA